MYYNAFLCLIVYLYTYVTIVTTSDEVTRVTLILMYNIYETFICINTVIIFLNSKKTIINTYHCRLSKLRIV